jgi:Domain of unknown function (DUF4129)
MPVDYRNKNLVYRAAGAMLRAGAILLLSGLLFTLPATAQSNDTVRVGEETDSVAAVTDKEAGKGLADSNLSDNSRFDSSRLSEKADPVVVRTIPDSVVRQWQKDKDFAYANDPAYWQREYRDNTPNWFERLLFSQWFGYFLLFLLGGVLLYVIVRIIQDNNLRLFYRSPGKKSSGGGLEEGPGPLEEDLEGQLLHFLQIKDHRQSVRYLYLKSLRLLNDRGLIRYHQESTNREYLQQLSATPQEAPFRDLTIAYEKIWYGEFPLDDRQFGRLHHYFEDFYKTCRS